MSTGLTEDIFQFLNKSYDLQNNSILLRKRNMTVFNETESLHSLAPKIWKLVPQSLKDKTELSRVIIHKVRTLGGAKERLDL